MAGQATYEFTGKNADGKILEIEHEIGQDELPQAVLDATKPYLPDFQPKFIERSIRTGERLDLLRAGGRWPERQGGRGRGVRERRSRHNPAGRGLLK
jgi:hypothetical protein